MNISTNHYLDIAHAEANPTITVLLALANALGVSVADLFESFGPSPDERRPVLVAELEELVAAHRRLTEVVERIAHAERWPGPRHASK